MMNEVKEPRSVLYKTIQNVIRQQIDTGALKPGDVVASERDLARVHGVSQMTARHALVGLANEGLLERRPGAHTVVALPRRKEPTTASISPYITVLPVPAVSPRRSKDVRPYFATRVPLASGQEVNAWRCEVMQRLKGRRVGLESIYFFCSHTPADPMDADAIYQSLRAQAELEIVYYDEQIGVTTTNHRACTMLGLMPGHTLLERRQLGYSRSKRVVCSISGFYLPAYLQLSVRRYAAGNTPSDLHGLAGHLPNGSVSLLEDLGRFDERVAREFSNEFQPWTVEGMPTFHRYD